MAVSGHPSFCTCCRELTSWNSTLKPFTKSVLSIGLKLACWTWLIIADGVTQWVRSFSMARAGRGRSHDVIDGPGPTGLARGKRTVTVIAYRLFHSPAKDLRYSAAANHINQCCQVTK